MLKWFHKDKPAGGGLWVAEVNYGSGWFTYGPPLPDRHAAEVVVRDLQRVGRAARVGQADPAEQQTPLTASKPGKKRQSKRHTRRHGRP